MTHDTCRLNGCWTKLSPIGSLILKACIKTYPFFHFFYSHSVTRPDPHDLLLLIFFFLLTVYKSILWACFLGEAQAIGLSALLSPKRRYPLGEKWLPHNKPAGPRPGGAQSWGPESLTGGRESVCVFPRRRTFHILIHLETVIQRPF